VIIIPQNYSQEVLQANDNFSLTLTVDMGNYPKEDVEIRLLTSITFSFRRTMGRKNGPN
jgi:hypothetical protein